MYELIISDIAKKQLKNLPENIKEDIGFALERIKIRPFRFVKKLRNSRYSRLRVGFYRLILDIKTEQLIITLIELGNRKEIYK